MMLRHCITFILTLAVPAVFVAQQSVAEIRSLLNQQSVAWNNGDIEGFMDGYVKSADLHFLGEKGLTSGWNATLERYRKAYPDKDSMGKLEFDIQEITQRTDYVYTVIGRYFLTRTTLEDLNGYFLLVVVKTDDGWKIAADSTH